jgi:hypothetical protein
LRRLVFRPQAEAARAEEKEGTGLVPNAPEDGNQGRIGELKEALHEVEEERVDWGKDR